MVMFGGFDSNYYQDFYYINMFELEKTIIAPKNNEKQIKSFSKEGSNAIRSQNGD